MVNDFSDVHKPIATPLAYSHFSRKTPVCVGAKDYYIYIFFEAIWKKYLHDHSQ